jgi:hypothetical protein
VYTLTANGCINKQNLVVTVNPLKTCIVNSSIVSNFNSTPIQAGRYIWFNSSFNPGSFEKLKEKETLTIYVTKSRIDFTANGRPYSLIVPDSRIRFDANVLTASTRFINNIWETWVPKNFNKDVFMGGLSFWVPANLPGNISNIKWTATINIDKPTTSLTWKWSAAVYSLFGGNAGLQVKPISGKKQNLFINSDEAGTPENFRLFVIAGARGKGNKEYTGDYTKKQKVTCTNDDNEEDDDDEDDDRPFGKTIPKLLQPITRSVNSPSLKEKLDVKAMPNPSNSYFDLAISADKIDNPVTVRIVDIFGQVWENYEKIAPNTVLRLGKNLKPGIYYATVIQGDQQKTVKLIKAN